MIKSKQSLIVLTPGFAENEADTTCIPALQAFIKTLKQEYPHLNIIVLAFQYPFSKGKYSFAGTEVISFNGRNRNKFRRFKTWADVWFTLRVIRNSSTIAGVLSCWLGECALVGASFARLYKLKHFVWIFGQDARPGNKYFRLLKPKGESLIALSDSVQKELFKNYSVKPLHVVPKGIVPLGFSTKEYERTIDIIGVGSLIPLKRYDLFIKAIKELHNFFPNLRAVICGEGPEKTKLHKLIEQLELQNTIVIKGEMSHPEVLKLMMQSKILLHPSEYEGLGMVCLEALYAGAHVVSFCRPIEEDIQQWHTVDIEGELVPKLSELLSNELEYKKIFPFSMQATCEQIVKLFRIY